MGQFELKWEKRLTYDESGNMVEGRTYEDSDLTNIRRYEYDKRGNWIKETYFSVDSEGNETISEVYRRTITYYL